MSVRPPGGWLGWSAAFAALLLIAFVPATGLLTLALVFALALGSRWLPAEDRGWLVRMAVAGWALRVLFGMVFYAAVVAQGMPDVLGPDGQAYTHRGWYLANLARGGSAFQVPNLREQSFQGHLEMVRYYRETWPDWHEYQLGAFTVLMGASYVLFGYDPILFRAINAACGVLTALLGFLVAKSLAGSQAGRMTMLFLTWLPSLFVFSTTNLRDAASIGMGMALLWSLVRFAATRRPVYLLVTAAAIASGNALREFYSAILLAVTMFALFVAWPARLRHKVVYAAAALWMLALLPQARPAVIRLQRTARLEILNPTRLFSSHVGYVNSPGVNYRILPDVAYKALTEITLTPRQWAAAMARGVLHVLFEPALTVRGLRAALMGALTGVTGFALALAVCAAVWLWRGGVPAQVAPLLGYLGVFLALLAISEGNAGTVFRHRDILMPAVAPLAAAGWIHLRRLRGEQP